MPKPKSPPRKDAILARVVALEAQVIMTRMELAKTQYLAKVILEPFIKQQEEKTRRIKAAQVRRILRNEKKKEEKR